MILLVEANLTGRPLQPVAIDVGLCGRDLSRQLLEVTIR
jgi:hypothetical protein